MTGMAFNDREADLAECLGHIMHVTLEPGKAAYHLEWAQYHLNRAVVGAPFIVAQTLQGHLDNFKSKVAQ
jgi:hypothetical protein